MAKNPDDYEVGYKKPPKHSRYPPGVSGRTGRRKKIDTHAEIIARVRDEIVEVGGKQITKFEFAIIHVFNQTIRSGKPRDLKILLELVDKYGALPKADLRAEAEAGAQKVIDKIKTSFLRQKNIDPADVDARQAFETEELQVILSSLACADALKQIWARPEYKALAKRIGHTELHRRVQGSFARGRPSREG